MSNQGESVATPRSINVRTYCFTTTVVDFPAGIRLKVVGELKDSAV